MPASELWALKFEGRVLGRAECPRAAASLSFNRWDPTSLDLELLWLGTDQERRAGPAVIEATGRNHFFVENLDRTGPSVEILGLTGLDTEHHQSGPRLTRPRARAVEVGITPSQSRSQRECSVIVQLQPSGILALPTIHETHYSGQITVKSIVDGEIQVDVSDGCLAGAQTYEYFDGQAHGNGIQHRVQRATLAGKVSIREGDSLAGLHARLLRDVDRICVALSLCYRQTVGYYEVRYFVPQDDGVVSEAFLRRKWIQVRAHNRERDELISAHELVGGGLQDLVTALYASSDPPAMERAIQFLAASYEARLPAAYFLAYSALETILGLAAESVSVTQSHRSVWRRVSRRLRQAIDESAAELGSFAESMKVRLVELLRPSLADRAAAAIDRYHPKTDDLWPNQIVADGLREATRLRNALVHAARAENDVPMYRHLVRVRVLAERLLLRIIGWGEDRQWTWRDQELRWMNLP